MSNEVNEKTITHPTDDLFTVKLRCQDMYHGHRWRDTYKAQTAIITTQDNFYDITIEYVLDNDPLADIFRRVFRGVTKYWITHDDYTLFIDYPPIDKIN